MAKLNQNALRSLEYFPQARYEFRNFSISIQNCNFIETIMTYILSKRQIVINIEIIANKKLTQKNVIFILAHYWY